MGVQGAVKQEPLLQALALQREEAGEKGAKEERERKELPEQGME